MTNDLTTTTGTAVALPDSDNPFAAAARSLGARDGFPFLQFNGNTGDFDFGKKDNKTEVPHGTQFVTDMYLLEHGFICWKDDERVGEQLWPLVQMPTLPPISSLPDHGPYKTPKEDEQADGWRKMAKMILRVWDCEKAEITVGQPFVFNPSNRSPVQAVADLVHDYSKLFKAHPGQYPIIEIGAEGFQSKVKKAGKKYACKLTIKGWISKAEYDEIVEAGEGEVDDGDTAGANDPKNYETTETTVAEAAPPPPPPPPPPPVTEPTAAPAATAPTEGAKRNRRF